MKLPHHRRRLLMNGLAIILLASGLYVLLTAIIPMFIAATIDPTNNSTTKLLDSTKDAISSQQLYIPKIDVNVPFSTGTEAALEQGAWWRAPQNGNPVEGGNFVLSAHRFVMGLTPQQTLRKSPFYNIDRLEVGDELIVDYQDVRYTYVIDEVFAVAPTAVEIEERTDEPRLTLYSCTLGGSADGREVIIAKLK